MTVTKRRQCLLKFECLEILFSLPFEFPSYNLQATRKPQSSILQQIGVFINSQLQNGDKPLHVMHVGSAAKLKKLPLPQAVREMENLLYCTQT
jgi:hypothetical protein